MTPFHPVTKEVFLAAFGCRTAGWFCRNQPASVPSPGDLLRMEQGKEVGKRARAIIHGGVFAGGSGASAASKTTWLMDDPSVEAIFEATFHVDGYEARADILRRGNKGWHLIEVKSNVEDKDELLDDLAYTVMVMHKASVEFAKASLWLVSKDYRLGMPDEKLFVEVDHTDNVLARLVDFLPVWSDVAKAVSLPKPPKATLIFGCKVCSYFTDICVGMGVDHHIFDLPRLSEKKFISLTMDGISSIKDIPDDFKLTENQERVRRSVESGMEEVDGVLADELKQVVWPAYYLDFETVMTCLPLYESVEPYAQIPTQYSIHVCPALGKITAHREFLAADPTKDCRRELAEKLIADLETEGTILAYHDTFEKMVIKKLADTFPDLAKGLNALLPRLLDLKVFISKGYYHPDFHGSLSIKTTLPVLVPTMGYDGLDIGEGDTAMAMFAKMAMNQCSQEEAGKIRRDLLDYCKQDTLAMVRIHERLMKFAAQV